MPETEQTEQTKIEEQTGWFEDVPETPETPETNEMSVEELRNLAGEKEKVEVEAKEKVEAEKVETEKVEAEKAETERVAKLAGEQGKTVDEITRAEVEKKEQDRLESVAKEEGVSVDTLKENEAKDNEIVNRHKGSASKIAKALRGLQSSYDKSQNELTQLKSQQEAQKSKLSDKEIEERCEENRDRIIEQYIKMYPAESEDLSEDVIFDRGKNLVKASQKNIAEKQKGEIKQKADDKRQQFLRDLKEDDREFKTDIEHALKETLDNQIIHNDFDIKELIVWARGKKYTTEHVKSLVDASFKRGQEQSKILGEKTKVGGAKPSGQQTYSHNLTDVEKDRALVVYSAYENWSDSKKFAEYEKIKDKDF